MALGAEGVARRVTGNGGGAQCVAECSPRHLPHTVLGLPSRKEPAILSPIGDVDSEPDGGRASVALAVDPRTAVRTLGALWDLGWGYTTPRADLVWTLGGQELPLLHLQIGQCCALPAYSTLAWLWVLRCLMGCVGTGASVMLMATGNGHTVVDGHTGRAQAKGKLGNRPGFDSRVRCAVRG